MSIHPQGTSTKSAPISVGVLVLNDPPARGSTAGSKKGKGSKKMPAWAMAAGEAVEAEEAELESLLSFAEDLNFDDYVESIDEADLAEVGKLKETRLLQHHPSHYNPFGCH